jgi:hypothetical protein
MHKLPTAAAVHNRQILAFTLRAAFALATQIASADAGWKSVDVPGAYLTSPAAINDRDVIAGFYWQTNNNEKDVHGFIRTPDGAFTSFDALSADGHTIATAINTGGVVAGWYTDSGQHDHGFVRGADGSIATFDALGAYDTWPLAINDKGAVAGYWLGSGGYHGFLQTAGGKIRSFDIGRAANTHGYAMNGSREVTGEYIDTNSVPHGFLRTVEGSVTKFNIPNVKDPLSLQPSGINASGQITGFYVSSLDYSSHGFVRGTDGTITVLSLGSGNQTAALGINAGGEIVGIYDNHGFLCTLDGQVTTLDFPGADDTSALSINKKGNVTGYYYSSIDGIFHGFLYRQ